LTKKNVIVVERMDGIEMKKWMKQDRKIDESRLEIG